MVISPARRGVILPVAVVDRAYAQGWRAICNSFRARAVRTHEPLCASTLSACPMQGFDNSCRIAAIFSNIGYVCFTAVRFTLFQCRARQSFTAVFGASPLTQPRIQAAAVQPLWQSQNVAAAFRRVAMS